MPPIDDNFVTVSRRDISGGINNRLFGTDIKDNQVDGLLNVDLDTPGKWRKRLGNSLVEDLGDSAGFSATWFNPDGGTDLLVVAHSTKVESYPGSGTFTERKTDFTSATSGTMLKVGEEGEGDVLLIKFAGNNWFRANQSWTFQDLGSTSGTGSDSPPDSDVALYYRGRLWILKGSQLFFSSTFPADYSSAFDTPTDWYRIPAGDERALIGLRDQGIIVVGSDSIWAINPSVTPVATDKPEKLLDIGCIAKKSVVQVGDEVFFLASDGVRALFRNVQDKLQLGASFPVSYPIKDEIDDINWAYANKACAVFFDNKYLLAVPTGSSTYNNKVYVYYPAFQGWSVFSGWNVGAWASSKFNNEDVLYYIDSNDGSVYKAFTTNTDNGVAISYQITTRREDLNNQFQEKNGGEVRTLALATGDVDITVDIEFDEGGFNNLGVFNVAGNNLSFPLEFPVTFLDSDKLKKSFQIDSYGAWDRIRLRFSNTNDTEGNEIEMTGYDVVTLLDEYQEEDLDG